MSGGALPVGPAPGTELPPHRLLSHKLMQEIAAVGPDLARSVFQLHTVGAGVLRRQVRRAQMLLLFSRLRRV